MALNESSIACLRYLKETGHFRRDDRVIEIGAQQLSDNFLTARTELEGLGRIFDAPLPPPLPLAGAIHASRDTERLRDDAPSAKQFYEWLGFRYASLDIDESPGGIPLDLNFDAVRDDDRGRYQLVTNFGTTEHVANQLNAFKIIHDLTALEGVMIHDLPTQGLMNHGLLNYNAKFFWMLARSNGYQLLLMNFWRAAHDYGLPDNLRGLLATFVDLAGGDPESMPYRTVDAGLVVVVKKKFDIAFVPPIDVNTGTTTNDGELEARYWTVFKPGAFEKLAAHQREAKPWRRDSSATEPVSTWDLEFMPMRFGQSLAMLDEVLIETRHAWSEGRASEPIGGELRGMTADFARAARESYRSLGIQAALGKLDMLQAHLTTGITHAELKWAIESIRRAAREEMRARRFLLLADPDMVTNVANTWEHVWRRFPSIEQDTRDSVVCFSVGCHAASLFHMKRVLEVGLSALTSHLGSAQTPAASPDALDALRVQLKAKVGSPDANTGLTGLYSAAASRLAFLRDAWRPDTDEIHAADRASARDVIDNVHRLMAILSVGLPAA